MDGSYDAEGRIVGVANELKTEPQTPTAPGGQMVDLLNAMPHGFDSRLYCVPTGTVVGQDIDGADMVVTDTAVVNDGNKWWCTEKLFNLIKEKTAKRLS